MLKQEALKKMCCVGKIQYCIADDCMAWVEDSREMVVIDTTCPACKKSVSGLLLRMVGEDYQCPLCNNRVLRTELINTDVLEIQGIQGHCGLVKG